jgi:transcriptional regulator with XRE-family HTH domain
MSDDTESDFHYELGRNIRAKRKQRHILQYALANDLGVHRNELMRWEKGECRVPLYMLLHLADLLSCNHLVLLPPRASGWCPKPGPEMPPYSEAQEERDPELTWEERTE